MTEHDHQKRPQPPHQGEVKEPATPPAFQDSAGIAPVPGSVYGLMAEFENSHDLAAAAHRVREAGYRDIDAYSPFPVEEVAEALGFHKTWMPEIVLAGAVIGLVGGYYLQYWISVIDYPLNVGGRPLHSWPSFIPVTFETTILVAALGAVFGMLALNGLPMPYHPLFNVERFALASRDRFFLVIEATDDQFEYRETRRFLESLEPREVFDVPH